MKRILYIISVLLLLTACDGKNGGKKSLEEKLYGEWQSTSLSVSGEVYLDFNEDKSFEMYQKIGEGAFRLYRGTWNIEENILTGKYNDGEDWAASYDIAIEDNSLTMTSKNDAAEVSKYASCTIPEEVKTGCEIVVKSAEAGL